MPYHIHTKYIQLFYFYYVYYFRYRGFFEPPGPNEYQFTMVYWEVLAARLAFIVVFEVITLYIASCLSTGMNQVIFWGPVLRYFFGVILGFGLAGFIQIKPFHLLCYLLSLFTPKFSCHYFRTTVIHVYVSFLKFDRTKVMEKNFNKYRKIIVDTKIFKQKQICKILLFFQNVVVFS